MAHILTPLLSIAPMIDWSYSHFRVFMRLLAPSALVYTEMLTTGAVLHQTEKVLAFNEVEHPIAIQLGGSDPQALAQSALLAQQAGYDEINLNLGCPSNKVQSGHFGACLMNHLDQVARCLEAMKKVVHIPVTVKTRIGIDHQDSYEFFRHFVLGLVDSGCDKLIVHARKAWLNGLSPKENRTIPPLHYEYVYAIKKELSIPVILNGNIVATDIAQHLDVLDGIMLGRLACDNPYAIAQLHHMLYPESKQCTRSELLRHYLDYGLSQHCIKTPLSLFIKPLLNLAYGLAYANRWKKKLMQIMQTKDLNLFKELVDCLLELELLPHHSG